MSDGTDLKMYEIQAGLEEIKEEMEKIKKENIDLKKNMAFKSLMEKVDDFQGKYSTTLGIIQEKLSTHCSSNDKILSEINETLRKQNETLRKQNDTLEKQNKDIQVLKKNMKSMEEETMLLLGGKNSNKMMDSLVVLQNNGEDDGNWKELNIKLPYAVYNHGAQFLNNNLYIFGGQNEKNEVLNSSYKLKRGHKWLNNSLQWEKTTDMNQKRAEISNSSVILNGRIWVIGGWNEKEVMKSVEMYDPQKNSWKNMKSMNECRGLPAAAVVHGKIFCCGGGIGENTLKSAECYDPSSDVWTFISDMPGSNAGCGAVEMDGYLIVIGGKTGKEKEFLNSVWVLDTTDKNAKWIEQQPCTSRRHCEFVIAKIHDKIFICGGYINTKDSKYSATDDVEIFDEQAWRNGPKLTTPLRLASAVAIPMEFARSLIE